MIVNHPINLTKGINNPNMDYKSVAVYNILNYYFSNIVINERHTRVQLHSSIVPVISLFTNKNYREMYLNFTKNSTDKYTERLRNILKDDNSRKNHYALMVEKIGDTMKKYSLDTFQITTIEYTEATKRLGGIRKKYYLNINGVKSEDSNVKDLTELYLQIKKLRARTKNNEKTLSKNA